MFCIIFILFPLLAVERVLAHGFLSQVVIDGTRYSGNIPGKYEGASPIRMISTIDPVLGLTNSNLNCGQDAQLADIVASASPGSNVTFQWTGGADGGEHWPHETGPLMTYMASCGSTSCAQFNGSSANWFKIDELGQMSNGSWYQLDIMNGDSYTITLPKSIKAGGYLIRHEIISLQQAVNEGGAEFYPSCTQVQIGGSGTDAPDITVTFPGGYNETGTYVPDIYDPGFQYVFPGPPISNLAAPGDGAMAAALSSAAPFAASSESVTIGGGGAFPSGTASASTSAASASAGTSSGSNGGAASPASVALRCRVKKPNASSTMLGAAGLTRRFGHAIMSSWRHST
ncbi:hypothetical protein IEO21_05399 [Rhodonia placenta]|uniref:lytic cellulose monooxygenase (C4-dehydrogenating) n=1 Tax=Rhodonia placenta TaxID=104341 RepID=A0A8H7U2C6_9APHY|nr:hypothetical protein IEO21_05399 [Postia placenta]